LRKLTDKSYSDENSGKLKKIIQLLADNPIIFNVLRRIIEANYVSLKKVIRAEFSLGKRRTTPVVENILDVPCGTGEFSLLFDADSYHGLDISEKYINYARGKYNRKYYCIDARQSGFDDDYFDKILTIGFLHHLDDAAISSVLREAKRVLKPDGVLLLIEDTPTSSNWNIVGKVLQKFDIGSNIRLGTEYKALLEKYFNTKRYYQVKSGFWDYSVFVLSQK
jgi:ubiquinone/menaquinone biosynthesis C-methylase UbiE